MFNLSLTKEQLLAPLLTVAGAVDKKQVTPILSNILVTLSDNQLLLTATDLEIEMTARIPCITSQSGQCTIPAKKLIDIIRSLDDGSSFALNLKATEVVIKAGRSQFKLATLPADDFPSAQESAGEVEFAMPRTVLAHLIQSTAFAASQNEVRVFLNGLLIELEGNRITVVATDGHRMAVCQLPCEQNFAGHRFLLPKKGVQEMLRLLQNSHEETIRVTAGKGHFKLLTEEYSFRTALLESRYPPYAKAIPRDLDKWVLADRDQLKRALSRMVILAHEKSRAVILHLEHGVLTLIANNQEQEEAIESIEAETEGAALKIGINAGYLLDVLNFIDGGLVRLSMSNQNCSILVESLQDEQYQYIIMPMRI